MTSVVGREQELSRIEEFLAAARERYVALVLEGEPGIGKTTVWREALRLGETQDSESSPAEAKLAYASLTDLIGSVEEEVFSELPEPQKDALDVAMLRRGPGAARIDSRAVATALTSVLSRLAVDAPCVVAVDDAQWLDRASEAALSFALRRLDPGACAAILVAIRIEPGTRSDVLGLERLSPERVERLRLGPLNLGGLYHVLRDNLQLVFPRPTLQRIEQASGGNPLFALEIGRLLREHGVPPGEPLPVPADLGVLIRRRLERPPTATRNVLLAAAMLPDPREDLLREALPGFTADDLEAAERQEIVALERDRIAFSHPLFAAAVHASASSAERRRMHRPAAETLSPSSRSRTSSRSTVDAPGAAGVWPRARGCARWLQQDGVISRLRSLRREALWAGTTSCRCRSSSVERCSSRA